MSLKYRPEIDGLRALAVVAVLLFHAEFSLAGGPFLPGGYLGVDVFFVISGFLIASIILDEQQRNGRFSFAGFYERRARRLLPALLLVALASLPLAWNLLLPHQLVDFAESVLASLGFASNFYWFQVQQEYAAESALLQPFLHTWSLAVEEQFYLLFPALLLFASRRWPRKTTAALCVLAVLGMAFAEFAGRRNVDFAFYLLPSRLWELLAGAALAHFRRGDAASTPARGIARALPAFGLASILAAMAVPGWQSTYPGLATSLPVLGSLLVIAFAGSDPATRLLASRPVVAVGLISYSLYLWHYPIYAFGRFWHPQPGTADKLAWLALAFALSAASWAAVERPFRNRAKIRLRSFLGAIALAGVFVVGVCAYWIAGHGISSRLGYLDTVLQRSQREWTSQNGQLCHSGGAGRMPAFPLSESCVFDYAKPDAPRTLVLVGDSHAGSLSEDVRRLAQANAYSFVQLTEAGCRHVAGEADANCRRRTAELRDYVARFPHATVIYSARVPLWLETVRFDNREGDREAGYVPVPKSEIERNFPVRAQALHDTLAGLAAVSERLVIVYPVPEQGFHIRDRLLAWRPAIHSQADLPVVSTSYAVFRERVRRSYAVLDRVQGANVLRVKPEDLLCRRDTGRCLVSDRDRLYYEFDGHLSPLGSRMLVDRIAAQLRLQAPASGAGAVQ